MKAADPIKIEGLKEFQAALKATEDGLQKELRVAFNRAAEIVVADAQRRIPTRSGRARAAVKAQSGQREAKVIGGSAKVPYYGWLEFGGKVGRKDSVTRPVIKSGRYIIPGLTRNREQVVNVIADGLAQLARSAGLEISSG